jgi:hypothetical protein
VVSIISPICIQIAEMFSSISGDISDLSVTDCLQALGIAKEIGWLDFTSPSVDIDCCIDMCEYLHYDSPANGGLHVVVPSELIIFPCPQSAPGSDQPDADADNNLHGRTAALYADALSDFGVRLVLRCGGAEYDNSAFAAAGIDVEDLPLPDPPSPPLLALAARRFVALTHICPGPVALHGGCDGDGQDFGGGGGGGGGSSSGGRRAVEALIAAYLVGRHAFDPPVAAAWARMARPEGAAAAAAAAPVFSLEDATAGPLPLHRGTAGCAAEAALEALQLEPADRGRRRSQPSAPAMGRAAAADAAAVVPERARGRSLALSHGPPHPPSPPQQPRPREDAEAAGDRVVLACR